VGVFEHLGDGAFRPLTPPPPLLAEHWPGVASEIGAAAERGESVMLGDTFLYLQHFLYDAEAHWQDGASEPLPSGIWNETAPSGEEVALEAHAYCSGDRPVMLMGMPTVGFERLQEILQSSREQVLDYHHLLKEIDRREVLLHCVVHDLSSPLAGIKGSLSFLKEDDLVDESGEELLDISLIQTAKLQRLVKEILSSYTDKTAPLLPGLSTSDVPDLAACAREVSAALATAAAQRGVTFRVLEERAAKGEPWRVVGDLARLERIFFNLIENALRHAPAHSTITIRLRETDHPVIGPAFCASVEDQGPGVPAEALPKLFQRFSQSGGKAGKAGLGLYFCRITVEGWGGEIGYRDAEPRGAAFWFELPRAA
jgi:signal transduction histidine kinase